MSTENTNPDAPIILVVEDELSLQLVIKKKLELNGLAALTARSVEEAKKHIETTRNIAAIWLDHYLLGKEDGLSLVAYLKQENSPWKKTPIVVVSNTATAEKTQTYIHYGVNKYYVKANCKLEQIVADIKAILEASPNN